MDSEYHLENFQRIICPLLNYVFRLTSLEACNKNRYLVKYTMVIVFQKGIQQKMGYQLKGKGNTQ